LRLTVEQAASALNCGEQDVTILVAARLLKPLGNPAPNARKYFATFEILELANDRAFLDKITNAIYRYWLNKNRRRQGGQDADFQGNREAA
jgi:hypothetical protein